MGRQKKLTYKELRVNMEKYRIDFKGPVLPHEWPACHKHHFQIIRDIWATRYDEYMKPTNDHPTRRCVEDERVRKLRIKAYDLRKDVKINEDTWRFDLENTVMERFGSEIVCHLFRHEKWFSDYEASPLDENERKDLEDKRRHRKECTCRSGREDSPRTPKYSGKEDSLSFSIAASQLVTHDPGDNLDKLGIPMRPDRIVGLRLKEQYRPFFASNSLDITHSPIEGRSILYPFLVVEAKREDNAPGFRYVEAQTSFPIRRLLKIQDDLRNAHCSNLNPLVWFFAFQGEEWRLYAGTLKDSSVVEVFDLWHGTIESWDGALQLCQIVDFIWSWARDIYRPQLLSGLEIRRGLSPTSTEDYIHSQSEFSLSSFQSLSQSLHDTVYEDDTTSVEHWRNGHPNLPGATSHPFLGWINNHDISQPWAAQTCIQHSDIVDLSFRVLLLPETEDGAKNLYFSLQNDEENMAAVLELLDLAQIRQFSVLLRRRKIPEIEAYWTGSDGYASRTVSSADSDEVIKVVLLFRTFCRPRDWQIVREVYCLVCPSPVSEIFYDTTEMDTDLAWGNELPQPAQPSEIIDALSRVRDFAAQDSVVCALRDAKLVLSRGSQNWEDGGRLQWSLPADYDISEGALKRYFDLFDPTSPVGRILEPYYRHRSRLVQIPRTGQSTNVLSGLAQVPEDMGNGGAILALKPTNWSLRSSQSCLFVLQEHDFDDDSQLVQLLYNAIAAGDALKVEGATLTKDDRKLLRDLMGSLGLR